MQGSSSLDIHWLSQGLRHHKGLLYKCSEHSVSKKKQKSIVKSQITPSRNIASFLSWLLLLNFHFQFMAVATPAKKGRGQVYKKTFAMSRIGPGERTKKRWNKEAGESRTYVNPSQRHEQSIIYMITTYFQEFKRKLLLLTCILNHVYVMNCTVNCSFENVHDIVTDWRTYGSLPLPCFNAFVVVVRQ